MRKAASELAIKELTPTLWPALEKLFGPNGACSGCWCMYWRIPQGERFADVKGTEAKRRFKALVQSRKAHGVLAFVDGEAVGWASYDRRVDFSSLDRRPSLQCEDAERVWSIPCFFIKAGWRGKGVASALLLAAEAGAAKRGARIVEGYPLVSENGKRASSSAAYTGVPSMFESAGFKRASSRSTGKVRYRKSLPVIQPVKESRHGAR